MMSISQCTWDPAKVRYETVHPALREAEQVVKAAWQYDIYVRQTNLQSKVPTLKKYRAMVGKVGTEMRERVTTRGEGTPGDSNLIQRHDTAIHDVNNSLRILTTPWDPSKQSCTFETLFEFGVAIVIILITSN